MTHIEKFAYDYATKMGYDIPKRARHPNTMHMSDVFDMIAGTSIGSISASAMSVGGYNNITSEPYYYAEDLIEIMTTKSDTLFTQSHVGYNKQIFGYIFFVIFFTLCFYYCGKQKYQN